MGEHGRRPGQREDVKGGERMSAPKRYYWLKLKASFFDDKKIKKMRRLPNGDTMTIVYLKMMLKSIKDSGILYLDGLEDSISAEVALDLDESEDSVKEAIAYLGKVDLLEIIEAEGRIYLPEADACTGSETDSAERVRKHRKKEKTLQSNTDETYSNIDVTKSNTEKEKNREDTEGDIPNHTVMLNIDETPKKAPVDEKPMPARIEDLIERGTKKLSMDIVPRRPAGRQAENDRWEGVERLMAKFGGGEGK